MIRGDGRHLIDRGFRNEESGSRIGAGLLLVTLCLVLFHGVFDLEDPDPDSGPFTLDSQAFASGLHDQNVQSMPAEPMAEEIQAAIAFHPNRNWNLAEPDQATAVPMDEHLLSLPLLLSSQRMGAFTTARPPSRPSRTAVATATRGARQTPTRRPRPSPSPGVTPGATQPTEIDLGEVEVISEDCGRLNPKIEGTTCLDLRVSCANQPALRGTLLITDVPEGVAELGTIVFGTGGGGTGIYEGFGDDATDALRSLNQAGYRIVQRAWRRAWEKSDDGMYAASCRYASLITWLEERYNGPVDAAPDAEEKSFCVTGNSGGAAEIGYALSRWGRAEIIDFALPSGGPPMSRLDLGCLGNDDSDWAVECPALVPDESSCLDDELGCSFTEGNTNIIDGSFAGTPCADRDLEPLLENSILMSESTLDYGDTKLVVIFGDRDCSIALPLGLLYYNAIQSSKELIIAKDTGHSTPARAGGAEAIRDALLEGCKPVR